LSFGEGTEILEAAAGEPDCARVDWYGSSAFAKNAGLAENDIAAAFAMQQAFRSPSFAPDPAAADLWEPFSARLEASLGREPEVYALTTQDALWLMAQARLEQNGKTDIDSFKSALVRVAAHRFGITGRLVFDAYGDREQSTYDFWGLTDNGSAREWKSVGRYSGAGGLVIF
jgi:ABC-type branched-subunit amino acid transport system substrate-binding protein